MQQGDKIRAVISNMNNEGEGVIRFEGGGFVLFVPDAVTGEEVTCRVIRKKRKYGIAKVLERYNYASERVDPLCPIFGRCGGCQLQHISYSAQLKLKTQTVKDALTRIGGVDDPRVSECVPSPNQWGYRNKVTVPVQNTGKNKFLFGFYKPRTHDAVAFQHCPVLLPRAEKTVLYMAKRLSEIGLTGLPTFKQKRPAEFIRHIAVRAAENNSDILCAAVGKIDLKEEERLHHLKTIAKAAKPPLKGFIYNENSSVGNFIWGDKFTALYGDSLMTEKIGRFTFSFEISSFFQINTAQTFSLYKKAAQSALSASPSKILELYSGTGSLTTFLATGAKEVTAVESWDAAARYILPNSKMNGFDNVKVCNSRAEDVADSLASEKFDVVVMDPPRSGCAPEVLKALIKISPEQIVYVSCAPATLARDVKILTSGGYRLEGAFPFDMFPQTGHVETVALMTKAK
jgi:23S rRNA (uracil1939-C5)-methyltransferase